MGNKLRSLLIYVLTAAVSFFFGLFILDQVILPQLTGAGREAEVPELDGMSFEEANAACRDVGLLLEVKGETYSNRIEGGMVLDQDPDPGLTVKQGRSVYVIMSKGPEMVTVPHLVGLTRRQAEILIENNFLSIDTVLTVSDAAVGRGRVVASDPEPGSPLPKGTAVKLTLSEGTPKIPVPSLIDKSLDEAREILTGSGLKIGDISYRFNRYLPEGKVIDQHPLERTPVASQTKVDLVVSRSRR